MPKNRDKNLRQERGEMRQPQQQNLNKGDREFERSEFDKSSISQTERDRQREKEHERM